MQQHDQIIFTSVCFSDISSYHMLTKYKSCEVQGYLESANKEIQDAEDQPRVREGLRQDHQRFSCQRREENLLPAEPETDTRRQWIHELCGVDEHTLQVRREQREHLQL